MASSFADLPLDVLAHMLTFIGRNHFIYMALVCKKMKQAYRQCFEAKTSAASACETLAKAHLAVNDAKGRRILSRKAEFCRAAANCGNLPVLKLFRAHGGNWDGYTVTLAVRCGDMEILQWLHQ